MSSYPTNTEITLNVQVGVGTDNEKFSVNLDSHATIGYLRSEIAERNQVTSEGVHIIWNGAKLLTEFDNQSVETVGIANGSQVIVIVSKTGKKDLPPSLRDKPEENKEYKIVLTCTFDSRPFGFAVWANAQGKNAIVTKVAGANALALGIQIGYVVYNCNGVKVFGRPHDEVLELLKTTKCPLHLEFADLGKEYMCSFTAKPLGFTVIQDREENNAKVSKINTRAAQNLGVLIGSYVVGVNTVNVFGKKHKQIIAEINRASFPINIKFRHPPPLLMLAPRSRKRTGKR